MRVADYVASRLHHLGARDVFSVTGGAAMHLNDAFGNHPGLSVHYMHHEQACAMAADGYARIDWQPAVVCVTSGPGALNAFTGVFGAYTDSIPMIVVSGQSRTNTLVDHWALSGLRQLGDQEARVIESVRPFVKVALSMRSPGQVLSEFDSAVLASISGRPGPIWIEIPVDVQSAELAADPYMVFQKSQISISRPQSADIASAATEVAQLLQRSKRPLILAGTGVRIAGVINELAAVATLADSPVATAWTHDVFDSDHALFAGRPGTIGTRPGNFVLQASDLVLVLGSRLNLRQISYNWEAFARNANIIHVDIDENELAKPYPRVNRGIYADLRDFLPALRSELQRVPASKNPEWCRWVANVRREFEPKWDNYPTGPLGINPYHLVMELNMLAGWDDVLVCGNAAACIVPFQVYSTKGQRRLFSNSGAASMGYDLPAAIGASVAAPDKNVVCLAGDGSIMMNLQELETLANCGRPIKLIILDNGGYVSIRQTQRNFFGRSHGSGPDNGLTFPDLSVVAASFGLDTTTLSVHQEWRSALGTFLRQPGTGVAVARLDPTQEFEPRLKSRMIEGRITTPELDDMYPHLPPDVIQRVRSFSTSN